MPITDPCVIRLGAEVGCIRCHGRHKPDGFGRRQGTANAGLAMRPASQDVNASAVIFTRRRSVRTLSLSKAAAHGDQGCPPAQ